MIIRCPSCDREALPGARFCHHCGARLLPAAPAAAGMGPAAPTPPHLARRILGNRAALEGERKRVTVLFADVKDSLEPLSHRDPEEASRLLGAVLDLLMEAVHRYEGTVTQLLGDGLLALFGAPLAQEDHAIRAAYAALRMQDRVRAYGEALRRARGISLQIRIGLNSGEVVVRSIENDLHMVWDAVGPTVHLAARVEQEAAPGTILATAETVRLAGPGVRTRRVGPLPVRGHTGPIDTYEVTGAAAIGGRLDAEGGRAPTRFVGREAELARVVQALEDARGGAGRVVAITGQPGIGKSRLIREFAAVARARGALVVECAALAYGRALAHRPGLDLLHRYLGVASGETGAAVRQKVTEHLLTLDPTLESAVAPILWLLGAAREGSAFLALDHDTRRRRAYDAVVRMAAREARRQPFVLVAEDLQWIDSVTQGALDALVERRPSGVVVLVSYRTGHLDRWIGLPGHRTIALEALPTPTAVDLVDGLVGPDPGVTALKRTLVARTGGNPLFLEECVRSLADTGALVGEPGAYRAARSVSAVEVPLTVQGLLAARLDRLPPDQKRVLQCAAAIGEEVPASLLEAVVDLPPADTRSALAGLVDAGLLEQTALFPDLQYTSRHSLAHDVAYASLLHDTRRVLHARIMEELERGTGEGRRVEQLAHHAFRGEVWERAVPYLREAGRKTLARLAGHEAVGFLERALDALGHLPETRERQELEIDLRHDLYEALVPLGEHGRVLEVLRAAEARAIALGDEPRLARTLAFLSHDLWELGESAPAVAAGERELAIAERLGERDLQVIGNFSMGGATRALGEYQRAAGLLRKNIELLARPHGAGATGTSIRETFGLPGLASVLSLGHLAWSLAELGEFAEAVAHAEHAIRIAEAVQHAYSLAYAHLGLGGTLLRQGCLVEAVPVLERGLLLCQDAPVLYPPMATDLGVISALIGRADRGISLAELGVAQARRMSRLGRLSLLLTRLGEAYVFAGRVVAAAEPAREALDLARERGERGNQVYALRLLGLIAAQSDPPDHETARVRYGGAMALAEELGMRPLYARSQLALGWLARQCGDGPAASRHLDIAAALFRELPMRYWSDRLALAPPGPIPH
ncbi:MAG: AAA family ATPase [Candidatus Rokubacteria bacterium]|nr:AAA family ATPase [Candidatus Rokubacteria bacterium]